MRLQGQVNQDGALNNHVQRMQEDDRPTAIGQYKNAGTLRLHGEETQVVHRNNRRCHGNRQPVAVIHQEGQQHENAEVHLQHAAGLVDMQRRHHHERRAHHATQQPLSADQAVQHADHHRRAATDQNGLPPRAMPKRQAQRVGEHQPQHAEHDAVGFAVMQFKRRKWVGHDESPG